jgi:hypothetical protein
MPAWPLPPGKPAIYPSTPGGITAPDLDDWQASYNGVAFGAGTPIGVLTFHGLGGLPTVSSHDQPFPRDTGEMIGVDALGGRDPGADLVVTANIFAQMVALGGALQAGGAFERPLWFQLPGLPTLCSMVRARTRADEWDANVASAGMWTPTLTFHATDPRLYAQAQAAYCVAATLPATHPLTITNAGNCETRPVLVLNGPLSEPAIQFGSGSPPTVIAFAAGTSVASGDAVVIDCSTPHTVTYWTGGIGAAGADAYNMLDQSATSWPTLLPGNNTLSFTAAQDTIDPSAFVVWWADAYML